MKVKEKIYEKRFDGEHRVIRFSDLPSNLQPDDIIEIHREEPFYSENNSYDGSTTVIVSRERERTQEEKDEMKRHFAELGKKSKEKRYKQYLELKKEFENSSEEYEEEDDCDHPDYDRKFYSESLLYKCIECGKMY